MKPHIRLHYKWSKGLKKYVWFADVRNGIQCDGEIRTSYYDTSAKVIKVACEYF